jgi:tetratricopeptide (TPR) repeat protein
VFDSAQRAFAARDSLRAGSMFRQARDLDVVRFRAPTEFNAVIRRVAQRPGVTYVPVAEAFAAASPGGIVGHELILEHLHPNQQGYALIARQFFDALHAANFLGHSAQMERLRPWDAYVAGMELTPFDRRIVEHTVNSVTGRWPFVPAGQDRDYRGTYHAVGMLDSLALLVSRGGMAWPVAKMELARDYERRQFPDSALAEYRGLMRDLPLAELPYELAGHVLIEMKRGDEALPLLQHAWGLQHTAYVAFTLGTMAAQHRDFPQAASYLTEASRLKPDDPDILYQLSLALALSRDLAGARLAAQRVAQLAPSYPGLAQWLQTLGQGAP